MKLSENLKDLIEKHGLNTLELARRTGIGQPVIYRIMTGETDNPKITTVRTLADYFGISVNQLLGETPSPKPNTPDNISDLFKVPLLTWEQVSLWPYLPENLAEKSEKVFVDLAPNPHLYALNMDDASMEPLFKQGSLLIIDSSKKPKDQDYIVVLLKKQKKGIFRQLLCDDEQYLKPLNPDTTQFKIKLFDPKTDIFKGTLVQAKINFL